MEGSYMDALNRRAGAHPAKPAIIMADSGETLSYADLDARATRAAGVFQSLGLRAGMTIALLMDNEARVVELWWGARRAGLYYVPLSVKLRAAEIEHILRDSGAGTLLVGRDQVALARAVAGRMAGDHPLRLIAMDGGAPHDGMPAYDDIAARLTAAPAIPAPLVGRELIYSSGTTGRPKGIRRDLAVASAAAALPELERRMRRLFELDERTVYLSTAPLYHATGRFVARVIEEGGTAIILPRFDPAAALAALAAYRATHSQWVPTMFNRLLALPAAEKAAHDLSAHRFALHAAAPCPPHLKRAMIDWWGPIVHEYYGGTENAGVTYISAPEWLEHPGSVGRPVLGQVHILSDDGSEAELPAGEVGLIYFDGGVPFTYLNDDGSSRRAHSGKGYATYGDLGHVDRDGYLYISDRRSDLIITGGVNVYPREVELLLDTHPDVREAAVIGVADADYGQRVVAVVCPAPGATAGAALAQSLIAFCREHLSSIKCPREISFSDELPRNETGKLLKRSLREAYQNAGKVATPTA